jgi:tetratricopeptide (TPR) repeat protein
LQIVSKKFISVAVFQIVFGLAVFAATREYYIQDADNVSAQPSTIAQPALAWPGSVTATEIVGLTSSISSEPGIQDPFEMSRQADEYFANKQYDRAADLYERLLEFAPNDGEIYNNLGITLHYLGRSTEALRWLNEGVDADADNQRIWLTLGYVNSQLGNTEQARAALTTAAQTGSNESIRESALQMLDALP